MSGSPVYLLDEPDPLARPRKAVWRQVHRLLVERTTEAAASRPHELGMVSLVGDDASLARALGHDLGVDVRHVPADLHAEESEEARDHVVALVLPVGLNGPSRLALLKRVVARVRPGGHLVVVATVVVAPRQQPPSPPSLSHLVRELHDASGMGVHLLDLQSVRWANEPFTRGACLMLSRLADGKVTP